MDEFDSNNEFNKLFMKCEHSHDIDEYFTSSCLPLLMQQNYDEKESLIGALFKFDNKNIISISDRMIDTMW